MKRYLIYILAAVMLTATCFWMSCSQEGASSDSSSSTGLGGSMARFTVKDHIMYVVDNNSLKLFDVSNAATPRYLSMKDQALAAGVETIFTMDSLLFIGSETGMYIYDVKRPEFPQRLGSVSHVRSCDPVVASGNYAYVTLNSDSWRCNRGTNELLVYDISYPQQPSLCTRMTLQAPKGLGVDGNKLFVCDKGLKIYDITNPTEPKWVDDLSHIPEAQDIDAYDVIPIDGILLLIGKDGFYQFDYTGERLQFLSKIEVAK